MKESFWPVDLLSMETVQVTRRGLAGCEVTWGEETVASARSKHGPRHLVETSLGTYEFSGQEEFVLLEHGEGEEVAEGTMASGGLQLYTGSDHGYRLDLSNWAARGSMDMMDVTGRTLIRLRDSGERFSWAAEVTFYFDPQRSIDSHMLLAVTISMWLREMMERQPGIRS
ncbi:MAG: hypothetical protein ACLFUV_09345 [Methanomassiliicoccales archaeon]